MKIKFEEFDIDLVFDWRIDFGLKTIKIIDDDDIELMFFAVLKLIG